MWHSMLHKIFNSVIRAKMRAMKFEMEFSTKWDELTFHHIIHTNHSVDSRKFKVVLKSSLLLPSWSIRKSTYVSSQSCSTSRQRRTNKNLYRHTRTHNEIGLMKMNFSLHQNATTHELSSDRYTSSERAREASTRLWVFCALLRCKNNNSRKTFSFTYHVIETHKSHKFSFDQNWKLLLYRRELKWLRRLHDSELWNVCECEASSQTSKTKPHTHTDHTRVRYAIKCEGGKEERSSRPKSWKTNLKMLLNIDPQERKPIVDVVILLVPLNSHTRFPPPAPHHFTH